MSSIQIILLIVLTIMLILFLWDKIRYDLVAFGTLVACVCLQIIPANQAFTGFGHPATITIALVLIMSKALYNAGFSKLITRFISPFIAHPIAHISILSVIGATLSSFMNNVGALALMMPIAIQSCLEKNRSVSIVLMPLSFSIILGGLTTLMGTPPNIIISSFRERYSGQEFNVFDFTPVGLLTALSGIIFLSLFGWRLLIKNDKDNANPYEASTLEKYSVEAKITKESTLYHKSFKDFEAQIDTFDITILSLFRKGRMVRKIKSDEHFNLHDVLIIEGNHQEILNFVTAFKLEHLKSNKWIKSFLENQDYKISELIVLQDSDLIGKTAGEVRLDKKYDCKLMGVSRQGESYRGRLDSFKFKVGDVLLVHSNEDKISSLLSELKCFSLTERETPTRSPHSLKLIIGFFGSALIATNLGILPFQISLSVAVMCAIAAKIISGREAYESINWPIIILVACLIPVGNALQETETSSLFITLLFQTFPSISPEVALLMLFIFIMLVTDILNNAAAAIIMAPIAIRVAEHFSVNADPFLIAVAIASSSSFLTPIGHQNNALIMGPGGYRFKDYWHVGLPLEIVITLVAFPLILYFWPL